MDSTKAAIYAIHSEVLPQELSRTQIRTLDIIEGAIKSYATLGLDRTTYESIAKFSKISRPLIFRYFKDKDSIFLAAVKYIRSHMQKMAVDAISKESHPKKQLEAYVLSTFEWIRVYPHQIRVWELFFYCCSLDAKLREFNTELVKTGHQRITALLLEGKKQGVFSCTKPAFAARSIQILITGALISIATEDAFLDIEQLQSHLVRDVLFLAGN